MSLINQMLRDLETRRAAGSETAGLPNEVRPLPAAGAGWRCLALPAAAIVAAAVAAVVVWGIAKWPAEPVKAAAPAVAPAPSRPAPRPAPPPEPLLKLDADLINARVPAALPSPPPPRRAPAPTNETASAPAPSAPVAASAPPAPSIAAEAPKPRIEKRPPVVDGSATAMQRAREQLNAGQRDAAEATLKQSLEAAPGHVATRQMLFALLMEQHRGDDALALLKDGLALHPEQTQWASNAARLQVDRNDLAGAWETLQRGLPAAAGQGEYQAFCGAVLSRLKRHGEAVTHYQAALRTNPGEGRWWVGLALAFEADGKLPESRASFARAQASGTLPTELAAFVESKLKQ